MSGTFFLEYGAMKLDRYLSRDFLSALPIFCPCLMGAWYFDFSRYIQGRVLTERLPPSHILADRRVF